MLCDPGVHFLVVPPPWDDGGGEVAVIQVEGGTLVAIPAVKYGLLFVTGYGTCLVEWALCVVGFTCAMEVECLEVHCAVVLAIVLCTHHHALTPGDRLEDCYWLKNIQRYIMVEASHHIYLPVEWYRDEGMVGDGLSIEVNHKPHGDSLHQW